MKIEDAGHLLDVIVRIDRFLDGYNDLVREKFLSKEEYEEMVQAFGNMDKDDMNQIKEHFKIGKVD